MKTKLWQIINDQKLWDSSLLQCKEQNFLQSYSFGEFHQKLGNKVWYLGVLDSKKIRSFALTIKVSSKIGSFLYLPWGPIIALEPDLKILLTILKDIALEEKVAFVRLEPRVEIEDWRQLNLKKASRYIQPQCSLFLDLKKSLKDLRQGLSESTRYNIGWVERQGVTVEISTQESDFKIFESLLKETSVRQRFSLHKEPDYYRKQFSTFLKNNQAKLFFALSPQSLGKIPLASAVVIYFGNTATYLHSASSSKYPKLRAPYLLQWKIIEDAKKSGIARYDFWGVAPTDDPHEAWSGLTAFKKSFGGERVFYPKPYDLIVSKKYYLMNILDKLRSLAKIVR